MTTLTSSNTNSNTNISELTGSLQKLKTALSGTNTHVCSHGHSHSDENEEEEIHDIWTNLDQIGEYIAATTGLLVLSPWINRLIQLFNHQIPLSSQNTPLKLSYISIILSAPFIYSSMDGAGYCHNKMNILPRLKKNLLKNVSKELSRDVEKSPTFNPVYQTVNIDDIKIALDPNQFTVISSSEAPSLSFHDYYKLFGDGLAHFVEYVGLWLVAINFYVKDKDLNLGLSLLCTVLAFIASLQELLTCIKILIEINALKNYQIIDPTGQKSHPALDYLNVFAALIKSMPVLLASTLNFKQISGNWIVGGGLGALTTASHIGYQYVINDNSKKIGQAHDEATLKDFIQATPAIKTTLVSYGFSIASERAEPFLFIIFAFATNLSKKEESAISASFLLLLLSTVPAAVRNALTHWNTFARRKGIANNYNSAGFLGCCASKKSMSKQEGLLTPLVEEEHKHSCGGHDHNHGHSHK